jgi:hypothetical protein
MDNRMKMVTLLDYMLQHDISVEEAISFLKPLEATKSNVQSVSSGQESLMEPPLQSVALDEHVERRLVVTVNSVPRVFLCKMKSRKAGVCPVCNETNSNLARHLASCAKRNNLGAVETTETSETSLEPASGPSASASKSRTNAKAVVGRTDMSWVSAGRWTFLSSAMQQELLSDKTIESYISKLEQYNGFLKEMLGITSAYATLEQVYSLQFVEKFVARMERLNHSPASIYNLFVALGRLWNLVEMRCHEPALFPSELGVSGSFSGSPLYQKIAAGMAAIRQMQRARGKQKRQRRIEQIQPLESALENRLIVPVKELLEEVARAEHEVFQMDQEHVSDQETKLASATLCMRFLLHECGTRTPLNAALSDLVRETSENGKATWTLRYKNSKTGHIRHLVLEEKTVKLMLKVHDLYRRNIHIARSMKDSSDLAPFLLMNASGGRMTSNTSGKLVMWFTETRLGTRLSSTGIRRCIQEQLNTSLERREISVEQFGHLNKLFLDHTAEVGLEHYSTTRSVRKDTASKELYRQVVIQEVTDEDTDSD